MQDFMPKTPNRPARYRLIAVTCLAVTCLVVSCLVVTPHVVLAAPAPNAATGQKLAQQYCAECHVVVPSSARGWTDAPAFDAIANRQGTTAGTLGIFIQQPHKHMLNTGRPPAEANEIAAYIMSLRKS